MSNRTRQKLIQAALELFIAQGVSNTTTRQIANLADVNEVTLFRQFGNKYGLVLAVIEEAPIVTNLEATLIHSADSEHFEQALRHYTSQYLQLLQQVPEIFRSVVGEANQYPSENRQAIGQRFSEINQALAQHLAQVIQRSGLDTYLPPENMASLLHTLLMGYAAIEFTSECHGLWQDQTDFVEQVVQLFLQGAVAMTPADADAVPVPLATIATTTAITPAIVQLTEQISDGQFSNSTQLDLPDDWVHDLLRQAQKQGLQDYALAYVLFGAGLTAAELVALQRSDQVSNSNQHLLQVATDRGIRQIPVNQWILGKHYGSYTNNPLTRWLKHRKDTVDAMFLDQADQPLSEAGIQQHWQTWATNLKLSYMPLMAQAQHTWCIEMLMRGISLENLSVLIGREKRELQLYAQRAKEKSALEQAILLDRKPRNS